MKIDNNNDLKIFARELSSVLLRIGEKELANELAKWDEDFFTTSSEFLGELNLILKKIVVVNRLDERTKTNVEDCIRAIDAAFGN